MNGNNCCFVKVLLGLRLVFSTRSVIWCTVFIYCCCVSVRLSWACCLIYRGIYHLKLTRIHNDFYNLSLSLVFLVGLICQFLWKNGWWIWLMRQNFQHETWKQRMHEFVVFNNFSQIIFYILSNCWTGRNLYISPIQVTCLTCNWLPTTMSGVTNVIY